MVSAGWCRVPARRLETILQVADNTRGWCMACSEEGVCRARYPPLCNGICYLLGRFARFLSMHRTDNLVHPQGPLWTMPTRLTPKLTDGLRFQRLTDVNAAYAEVANAFWLQARKVGPLKGKSMPPPLLALLNHPKIANIDSAGRSLVRRWLSSRIRRAAAINRLTDSGLRRVILPRPPSLFRNHEN
jgi:hypothetical protein